MKIGIDFDNTIICYDSLFKRFANDHKIDIPTHRNPKSVVKAFLLQKPEGNFKWTSLQGEIYGNKLAEVEPHDGFLDFVDLSRERGHELCIISHKSIYNTLKPYRDLHRAARNWLSENKVTNPSRLDEKACFFECTQQEKILRIQKEKCDIFIDDLIAIFKNNEFPSCTYKILFGSRQHNHDSISSWHEAFELIDKIPNKSKRKPHKKEIHSTPPTSLTIDQHRAIIQKILDINDEGETSLKSLSGGKNNKVYRVITNNEVFLAKAYYRNSNDNRSRQHNEVTFLEYLNKNKSKWTPKVISNDFENGISIFSWIEGSTFEEGQTVSLEIWKQCISFLNFIQNLRNSPLEKNLPPASEAAFSYQEHLGILQKRHDSWLQIAEFSALDTMPEEIKKLIVNEIEDNYCELSSCLLRHPDFTRKLTREEQIVSPSDFGLHNAILQNNTQLRFIDFEYAGWDDPAKMLADFFAQPRITAPSQLYSHFKDTLASFIPEQAKNLFYQRLPLIDKIVRLKWCYIILNSWHPVEKKRRNFAGLKSEEINITISKIKNLLKEQSTDQL